MNGSLWTDEKIERLRAMWAEGKTAAEIGLAINVSPNAVIGKRRRLGLPGRPSPIRNARPRPPKAPPKPPAPRPHLDKGPGYTHADPAETCCNPPPAPFVTDHKWLDPECHASGCQTLILKAEVEKLKDQRDKYMWQVRDTCARAEAAEADAKWLRDASKKAVGVLARAFDRIHCLPRTSDTELANDISATMTALAQGGNDG